MKKKTNKEYIDSMSESDWKVFDRMAAEEFAAIKRADYKRAFEIANRNLKRYPWSFYMKKNYASVMGDYAECCPPAKKRKLKRESIELMRKLLLLLVLQNLDIGFHHLLSSYIHQDSL